MLPARKTFLLHRGNLFFAFINYQNLVSLLCVGREQRVGRGREGDGVYFCTPVSQSPPWATGQPWRTQGREPPSLSAPLSVFLPVVVFGSLSECAIPSLFSLLGSCVYLRQGG